MKWHDLDIDRKTSVFLAVVGTAILVLLWPSSPPQPKRPAAHPPTRQAPRPQRNPQVNRAAGSPSGPGAQGRGGAAPAPALAPAVPPAGPFQQVLGIYQGSELLPNGRGRCTLRLELARSTGKSDEFTSFTRLTCAPFLQELLLTRKLSRIEAIKIIQLAQNPTAAILTGIAVNGSIELHAEKNIGVRDALHGCEMTVLTFTPAGKDTIDVEWQEASEPTGLCRGAQMQMRRIAR